MADSRLNIFGGGDKFFHYMLIFMVSIFAGNFKDVKMLLYKGVRNSEIIIIFKKNFRKEEMGHPNHGTA